ncbi:MAG TPA: sugar nucleotide-binding protein, partial [Candidatus Limnocylindrales bacterium]|nr:sugar nucleotide-binding protein [Candidatus Limnocylindrales bacterium]
GGTFHLVNAGFATRFDWAREILTRVRPDRPLRAIDSTAFSRPSTPPRWGVLDTSRAASLGIRLRPWQEALAETLAEAGAAAEAGPEAGAEAGPGAGAGAGAEAGPGAGARTP